MTKKWKFIIGGSLIYKNLCDAYGTPKMIEGSPVSIFSNDSTNITFLYCEHLDSFKLFKETANKEGLTYTDISRYSFTNEHYDQYLTLKYGT